MKMLSKDQLGRLEFHKYKSTGTSLIEPFFQVFWNYVVNFFPQWIAPNAITIIGLINNVIGASLLLFYCPTATEVAPSWVYFVNAIGLFIYQVFDAIDGKQARRTNSSTPLGELFDHGCDSVSCCLVALSICISLQVGHYTWSMMSFCLAFYFCFYYAHWCAYVTGVLQFGKIDVTEVQCLTMLLFIITGILGPQIWGWKLPIINLPLNLAILVCSLIGSGLADIRVTSIILKGGCGENGATCANTSVLSPGFKIGVILILALSIAAQSNPVCQDHLVLYLLFVGIISSKATNQLVVAHMTKSELISPDTSLIGLLVLLLNIYFGFYINEHLLLWICFIFSAVDFLWYVSCLYKQIADHLNIYIFSLQPRSDIAKIR